MKDTISIKVITMGISKRGDRERKMKRWLKQFKPDAIISDGEVIPKMLEAAGYRIPEDIDFAALSYLNGRSDSGINQNSCEVGRVAVRTLVSFLHNGAWGIPKTMSETLVHGEWVQGKMLEDRSGKEALMAKGAPPFCSLPS